MITIILLGSLLALSTGGFGLFAARWWGEKQLNRLLFEERDRLRTALGEKDSQLSVVGADHRSERNELIDRLMDAKNYQRVHQKPVPRETPEPRLSDDLIQDMDRVYGQQLERQAEFEVYEEAMMQKAEADFEKDINQIVNN